MPNGPTPFPILSGSGCTFDSFVRKIPQPADTSTLRFTVLRLESRVSTVAHDNMRGCQKTNGFRRGHLKTSVPILTMNLGRALSQRLLQDQYSVTVKVVLLSSSASTNSVFPGCHVSDRSGFWYKLCPRCSGTKQGSVALSNTCNLVASFSYISSQFSRSFP